MIAAQYNIRSGRSMAGDKNLEGQAAVLRAIGADVISLNEVRMGTTDSDGKYQADELGRMLGMHSVFGRAIDIAGGEYGVAILSRYPIAAVKNTPVPNVPEGGREPHFEPRTVLLADAETPDGIVHVITSHFGLSHAEQVNAVDTVCAVVDRLDGPVIFMGDLNVTEDDPVLRPLDERMESVFRGSDVLTFSSEDPVSRIDYLYIRGFKAQKNACVDTQASDHRPIWAQLVRA